MKTKLTSILILLVSLSSFGQTIDTQYLNPIYGGGNDYKFLRFGTSTDYKAGLMWNNTSIDYGDGDDFSIFTYNNRDITLRTGTGNIIMFPTSGGNVGIGTKSPISKLQVTGATDTKSAFITSFGNLSDSDFTSSNWYRTFYGSTYTDGNSGNIGRYFSYRSIYGGYADYQGGGPGFYSQGHYPRMFMEVISGNHGGISALPADSPIKTGYIYQQIKGPQGNQQATPLKATKNNSQWLWGISSAGEMVVAGKIHSREVKVTVDAGADFVFDKDYNLKSLSDLEDFIQLHGHLPEIASANEMKKEGIHLSEMSIKLLQKIEELTLYTIAQEKELKAQQNKNKELEQRLAKLEQLITKQ